MMKITKTIIAWIALLLTFVPIVVGCDEDKSDSSNPFIGKWELVQIETESGNVIKSNGTTLEFTGEGVCTQSPWPLLYEQQSPYGYAFDGKVLKIDVGDYHIVGSYRFSEDGSSLYIPFSAQYLNPDGSMKDLSEDFDLSAVYYVTTPIAEHSTYKYNLISK